MTKQELVDAIQALPCAGDTEVIVDDGEYMCVPEVSESTVGCGDNEPRPIVLIGMGDEAAERGED